MCLSFPKKIERNKLMLNDKGRKLLGGDYKPKVFLNNAEIYKIELSI